MKKHMILLGFALGLMLVPAQADEEHTPLGNQMESLDDAFKGFRRETDAKKGATEARAAQVAVLKSAMEVPELVKAMPDGPEKDVAANDYRMMMGKLYLAFVEVEKAFLKSDLEAVTSIVDTLKEMKKEGHTKFIDEEE